MQTITILVPRINDGYVDFYTLGKIWQQVDDAGSSSKVIFDFTD